MNSENSKPKTMTNEEMVKAIIDYYKKTDQLGFGDDKEKNIEYIEGLIKLMNQDKSIVINPNSITTAVMIAITMSLKSAIQNDTVAFPTILDIVATNIHTLLQALSIRSCGLQVIVKDDISSKDEDGNKLMKQPPKGDLTNIAYARFSVVNIHLQTLMKDNDDARAIMDVIDNIVGD